MSKNFKLLENDRQRNKQAANQLNDDALEGLRETARNNQPAMALRYILFMGDILEAKLTEIDAKLAELDAKLAKSAPAKATKTAEASADA